MSLVNSPKIIGVKPNLSQDQLDIVDLIKETLAQAIEGRITTIGIVACMKGGYASVMAGRQASDLNLGCDALKAKILARIEATDTRTN